MWRAINKYGKENFTKEVLHVFDSEEEMLSKEKELVTEEFCKSKDTYNLNPGGKGGFGYINTVMSSEMRCSIGQKGGTQFGIALREGKHPDILDRLRRTAKDRSIKGNLAAKEKHPNGTFFGKVHTDESKEKLRRSKNVGSKNSQFGTKWMIKDSKSIKIKNDEVDLYLKLGYKFGRKIP